jgi:hypothetical protein
MQLLVAKCGLGSQPPFGAARAPLASFQPHILPALQEALSGFARLRCPAQCAQVHYLRARIWHTVGATEERDRDAAAFHAAEAEAVQAAARLTGRLLDFAAPGVLEEHIAELDAAAAGGGGGQ